MTIILEGLDKSYSYLIPPSHQHPLYCSQCCGGFRPQHEDPFVKEHLKHSQLGQVINFLSKYDEEVLENKILVQCMIDEWRQVT